MSPQPSLLTSLAAAIVLAGCAGHDYDALGMAEDGVPDEYLRVDIFPSDRNAELMPQSLWVDGWFYDGGELNLSMQSTVDVQGEIRGVLPLASPAFEGRVRSIPVEASVDAWIDGTVMASSTVSDSTSGAYQLSLVPQEGYIVAVIPEDGSHMPFAVYTDQNIVNDRPDWNLHLDNGATVRGSVVNHDGQALAGLEVRAVHRDTGVAGPSVTTRSNGGYSLHLAPDAYDIEIGGTEGGLVPTTTIEIQAEDNETGDHDLVVGSLVPVTASGRVLDGDSNRPVEDVEIRLWSLELEHHPDASLELTAATDQAGHYTVELLPGTWRAELTPPTEASLTPMRASFTVNDGQETIDLGASALQPYVTIQSHVHSPNGEPAMGVTVVASEDLITGRTFTATTDEAGAFTMNVPQGPLHAVLTPGDTSAAVTHVDIDGDDFPSNLGLSEGRLMTGRIVNDGQPVEAALVEVRHGSSEALYATTFTDSDGHFELRLATSDANLAPADDEDGDTGAWDTGYLD